jgi:hypothetical protein
VVDRERAENNLIEKSVKGGRRSNSERERKYGGGRKRRAPAKRSYRKAQVVYEISQPSRQPDVAHFLSNLCHAPEIQHRTPSRLGLWQTRTNQITDAAVDVVFQFAVQFVLQLA